MSDPFIFAVTHWRPWATVTWGPRTSWNVSFVLDTWKRSFWRPPKWRLFWGVLSELKKSLDLERLTPLVPKIHGFKLMPPRNGADGRCGLGLHSWSSLRHCHWHHWGWGWVQSAGRKPTSQLMIERCHGIGICWILYRKYKRCDVCSTLWSYQLNTIQLWRLVVLDRIRWNNVMQDKINLDCKVYSCGIVK